MEPPRWLFLQLVDGAFPSGGFAHSGGLEAAVRLGALESLEAFLEQSLWQCGRAQIPFARAACERPAAIVELDRWCDARLVSPVANRASRAQGRALVSAATRIFRDHEGVGELALRVRSGPAHHAPVLGALFAAVGLGPTDVATAMMHGALRSLLSAAVRLGVIGPLEAQELQASSAALLDRIMATCAHVRVEDGAHTAPIVELLGGLHDELDGRLFQT